jgi:hypothetical protein
MQLVARIPALPENALRASAEFYRDHLDALIEGAAGGVDAIAIVFAPAPYDHKAWRRAVLADLARQCAPVRINGVSGEDGPALSAALSWLDRSPGVTGQLLCL